MTDIRQAFVILPLERAVYCENCRQISNSTGDRCIACDSVGALLNLARVLEREPYVCSVESEQQSN